MKRKEESIELNNKKVSIEKLIESFVVIPSSEIVKYLKNKEIFLPNYLHKALVRKNIAPIIANADNNNKFSDEMKHRLKWFDRFTIFQLERLADSYGITVDVKEYKKDFWDIIVHNRGELGINNLEFIKLQNLTMKYQRSEQEKYQTLKDNFSEVYFEPEGYFEGCRVEEAREVLQYATTMNDIRELGKKHGVEIPRRINKRQLIEIIAIRLNLNDAEQEKLEKKSILDLERYAKENNINMSIELKKVDMVEYILIKRQDGPVPVHEENSKIFEGINIEEYLYNAKFEEIAQKYTVAHRRKNRVMRDVLIALIIVTAAVAVVVFDLL
ncbi:MAG: hypothetical protein ACOCU5_03270 [Bacillota bacterium]